MSQHLVTLLLGSNLGNSEKNLEIAIERIEAGIGELVQKTEIIKTKPVEFVSNNIFCNIALIIKTQFSPVTLLKSIKRIEQEMGRIEDTVSSKRYTDRIIDIDIVLFDDVVFYCNFLQIPHDKHLNHREFSRKLLLMTQY